MRTEAKRKTADGGVLVSRTPPPRLPNSVTPSSRPDRAPADVGDRRDHGDSPETSPMRSPAAPRLRRRSSTPPPTAGQPDGSRQVVPEVGSGNTEGGSTSEGGRKISRPGRELLVPSQGQTVGDKWRPRAVLKTGKHDPGAALRAVYTRGITTDDDECNFIDIDVLE